HPKPPSGGPSCQWSLVKRIMARRLEVRLMSPRIFSSRQLVGTPKDLVKLLRAQGLGSVGAGYAWSTTCAAGLKAPGLNTLGAEKVFAGAAVGRWRSTAAPALFDGQPNCETALGHALIALKSPAFSAVVGTRAVVASPSICLFHSW